MASEEEADLEKLAKLRAVGSGSGQTPREAAEYIAQLVDELSALARGSNLPVLAYLLDVAGLEAKTRAHELTDASRRADRLAEIPS